jgi:hypothetical protein
MRRGQVGIILSLAIALLGVGCDSSDSPVRTETVEVDITEAVLAGDDAFAVIEPVWDRANIYGSVAALESSLEGFSEPQRLMFALHWYIAEVNNGGHHQFFYNSTGILWPEALAAFEAIEVDPGAEILQAAVSRLGESPSRDRSERQAQLEATQADFDDLDARFYALQDEIDLNERMLQFMRSRSEEFFFRGTVERAVFER